MMDLMISICSRAERDVANVHLEDAETDVLMSSLGCFPPFRVRFDGHMSVLALRVGAASLDAILDEGEGVSFR